MREASLHSIETPSFPSRGKEPHVARAFNGVLCFDSQGDSPRTNKKALPY